MSFLKKWVILPPPPEDFIAAHPELPPSIVRLLWNRNLKTQAQIDEFLNPDYSQDLHDPFLFNDMAKAVAIIFDCLANHKKITVHGDYDADGVCAAVVITAALKKLGGTDVNVFLPHRETDGYGLNPRTVQYLKDNGTQLIITCDCGISNTAEIKLAKELGLLVIVTDHHAMPKEFPPADAIIHPLVPGEQYPDKGLAGGGVAFKLVQGLLKEHAKSNAALPDGQTHEACEKWLLDMVAISTVADMVPLLGESRTLVRYGLTVMSKTRNVGLRQLLVTAGLMTDDGQLKRRALSAENISFQIAPRINAAGRMDHANAAFALLAAETLDDAQRLAAQLQQSNVDRQKLTEQLVTAARGEIRVSRQANEPIIYVLGQNWSVGILGLIASKIKEEFYKPTLVMTQVNGVITGSGRSIKQFNMIRALQEMPEFFSKFGGHPQACGFSLQSADVLEAFKAALKERVVRDTASADVTPQVSIDAEVDLSEVDWRLYDLLQKFEPFGQANEPPRYAAYGLTVVAIEPVGSDGKHLRLMLKHNSHVVRKTIGFGLGDPDRCGHDWKESLKPGDLIDMIFTVGVNEWNGNRELQLTIEDLRKHELLVA